MRIGLIVRCKDEPYVSEFVRYYLSQGVDHIYIVDDQSSEGTYKDVITNSSVTIVSNERTIITKKPREFFACKELYKTIRGQYDWIINVDMDEFIATKKNGNKTIRKELETTFKDCACIKIPWVMMACNSIKQNPPSLLKGNIYRWNHDVRHQNSKLHNFRCRYDFIEVKCIFKPQYFDDISNHIPLNPTTEDINVVTSVHNQAATLSGHYGGLREKDIEQAYLICYHYRLMSVAQCIHKIATSIFYKDYSLEDLLASDYPELKDETMRKKANRLQI